MMTMNSRKTLEKKQLKSLFWRSFTTSHAWHYERQQHMAFEFAMIPVINKLYDKEEDRIDAYKRAYGILQLSDGYAAFYLWSGSGDGRRECQ